MSKDQFLKKLYEDIIKKGFHIYYEDAKDLSEKKQRLMNYLDKLTRVQNKLIEKDQIDRLKELYYNYYVIKKENISDDYFHQQEQLYLDRGYGHYTLTSTEKEELISIIIKNQQKSLDNIIDYFLSEDSRFYPQELKYWAFQGLVSLGSFDKEKRVFLRRSKSTINKFVDFNREALALTINTMNNILNGKNIEEGILKTDSFNKLYTYYFNYLDNQIKDRTDSTKGIWIKYPQGTDHKPLVKSLEGKGTGWCTAGEETAKKQLKAGDFYVYYTEDINGEFKNPRIAIRMDGKQFIGEIRGVAKNQNLEPEMIPILEEKLREFPDCDEYQKKVSNMEKLTKIYKKYQENLSLSKEDLRFLYQIDEEIIGFGYETDPRIEEIIEKRDSKKDLILVFNCQEDEIGLNIKDFNKSQITKKRLKFYYDDLDLRSSTSAEGLVIPEKISGNLYLSGLTSTEDLVLPKSIGGSLHLRGLTSTKGLVFPENIGGNLDLAGLTSAEDLVLPENIGGNLYLSGLTSAEGLVLPKSIGGNLYLEGLTSTKGLVLPENIGCNLNLEELTSAKGLILPKSIGCDLNLRSLTSAEGLVLPKSIGRNLDLAGLTSAKGLVLPENIGCNLNLRSLTSAEFLVLPKSIGCRLYLNNLKNTEGLILPENIGGALFLKSITFDEFLKLEIKDFLYQRTIYLADITIYSGKLEEIINKSKIKIKKKI